ADRGWTHAGDDLVVLAEQDGVLMVFPGKPTAAFRTGAAASVHQPKPVCDLIPFADSAAPLERVIRLDIHPQTRTGQLISAKPFSPNEYLRLHENLARYISGIPTPLTGVKGPPYGPVWPLDTPDCAAWRAHLITRLEHYPFDYLAAPGPNSA